MAQLHAAGVDMMVELLDAADHVDRLKPDEIQDLLRQAASVLGELLKRDVPGSRRESFDTESELPVSSRAPD